MLGVGAGAEEVGGPLRGLLKPVFGQQRGSGRFKVFELRFYE